MRCMGLKIGMSDQHHRYYKYTMFRQNPSGDPTIPWYLTWNDPIRDHEGLRFSDQNYHPKNQLHNTFLVPWQH